MTRFPRILLLALVALAAGVCQQDGATTPLANNIFSGAVTALAADSVTVVRKVPAKPDVSRTFSRDAQTKVDGRPLKLKSRVTVRYEEPEDGKYLARHIIVH